MNLRTISPVLFLAGAFTLATVIEPIWSGMQRQQAKSVLDMMVGDGKRLFANHFIAKADIYFHNGYYPSIFDQAAKSDSHLSESHLSAADESKTHEGENHEEEKHEGEKHEAESHEGHDHGDHSQCDHDGDGKPDGDGHGHEENTKETEAIDFIQSFGRHFFVSKHSHIQNAASKELLPWFKISAELDPNRVETYTVAAFWLRNTLNKIDEAESFLRQGWKSNPDSYQIIFELGRLYESNRKDHERARNLWELALKKWAKQESGKEQPDVYSQEQILAHLVELEYYHGDLRRCLGYLQQLEPISPYPDTIRKHIEDVKSKLSQQK